LFFAALAGLSSFCLGLFSPLVLIREIRGKALF